MRPDGGLSIVGLAVQSGPRFARDALGPLLVFYASWKLVGLAAGIAVATVVTVGVYVMTSRLRDRTNRPDRSKTPGEEGRVRGYVIAISRP